MEAVKVTKRPPGLGGRALLRPRGALPLGDGTLLLELLADDTGAGGAGEFGEDEGGEGHVAVGEGLAGHAGGGAIDDSLQKPSP